jgi:hypothetical protein
MCIVLRPVNLGHLSLLRNESYLPILLFSPHSLFPSSPGFLERSKGEERPLVFYLTLYIPVLLLQERSQMIRFPLPRQSL